MLKRRPLVKYLLSERPENLLAVSGLGSSTWDVTAAGDDARNFCFIGAMGQAAPFALGLAMARPEHRVVLITGDGELLMGIGTLATIAAQAPTNLAIAVMDNGAYVETGGQATATAGRTNIEQVAVGMGIENTCTVTADNELEQLRTDLMSAPGPFLANVKIDPEALPLAFPHSFDGVTAINRFRDAALS
ncbi:MAG: aldehyde dehydrogenase [Gammaproteobacteria bacterium]|nr:aldehyde dehydrogenase [Gammaproteobacteria bacterium]|tara:strand:- start:3587 stop:4156 length:570 start_codon:yes stop_codon:yes gene_type:complete